MKTLFYLLTFLFLLAPCYAQDVKDLPAKPWEELVEMNADKKNPIRKWGDSINVTIEGLYKVSDSLVISKIVKKLDSITETTVIRFTKAKDVYKKHLKIKFLDKYVKGDDNRFRNINSRKWHNTDKTSYGGELYVYVMDGTDLEIRDKLENQIAKMLVDGMFAYPLALEKRNSIFNPLKNSLLLESNSLNAGDISIIKEVYKKGFTKRLKKAEQQFSYVLEKLENNKIKSRDKSLWWVKNPIAVMFLPVLILALFFIFLISKLKNAIYIKIKNNLLRFSVLSFVALLFAAVVIIFCVSFYDFLITPNSYGFSLIRKDTIITTGIFSVLLFPLLYLFRYLESKIQKTTSSVFTKTVFIFLSTVFLPFIAVVIIFVLTQKGANNPEGGYLTLSYMFLFLMSVASIRALISYFIFIF